MKGFILWQRCCSLLATSRKWFNDLTISIRLIVVIALLNLADFYTTMFIVGMEGHDAEFNPFMRYIIESFGIYGILWWKCIWIGVLFGGHFFLKSHHRVMPPKVFEVVVAIACAAYTTLIIYNSFRVFQVASYHGMM